MTPSTDLIVCEPETTELNPFEELLKIEGLPKKEPPQPQKRWRVVGVVYGFRWVELEFEEVVKRKVTHKKCTRCGKEDDKLRSYCYNDGHIETRIEIAQETITKREKVRQRVIVAVKVELS